MKSKLDNLSPEVVLLPFKKYIGESFGKICRDMKSWLGNFEKDIVAVQGEWKTGAKGKFTSKDGYTLMLPPNDSRTILMMFSNRLAEVARAGEFQILDAEVPKTCQAWIKEHSLKNEIAPETAAK